MVLGITLASFALFAEHISAIVGLGKGIHGLYKHLTRSEGVTKLRQDLQSLNVDLSKPIPGTTEEIIDQWLTSGELLFPYVRKKLINRFIVSLTVIIGAHIAGAELRAVTTYDTWINLFQALVQVSVGFWVKPQPLLDAEERNFMKNLTALHEVFYNLYVLPNVKLFNSTVEGMMTKPDFDRYEWESKRGAIQVNLERALKEPEVFADNVRKSLGYSEPPKAAITEGAGILRDKDLN